jgi:hypothetical protein
MLKKKRFTLFHLTLVLTLSLLLGLSFSGFAAQPEVPTLETPLAVTTCGQSPGALMIWVLSKQIKLKAKADAGTPYKTLIITTGTSMKGMGAAGVDIDFEVARIKAVIEEAKKEGIFIVGAHIEGMARRVDDTDAASIATVTPESSLLLIREDSNEDGYFTKAAEAQNVPIITFKETLDLSPIFQELFNLEG